jgi:hypothetical protein
MSSGRQVTRRIAQGEPGLEIFRERKRSATGLLPRAISVMTSSAHCHVEKQGATKWFDLSPSFRSSGVFVTKVAGRTSMHHAGDTEGAVVSDSVQVG